MMNKIWHKFLLLAVLGFMPILSHAQFCSSGGPVTVAPKTTPFPGGWKVVLSFNPTITHPDCLFNPTQISSASSEPQIFTKNGVTVNIRDAKLRLKSSPACGISGDGTVGLFFSRCARVPQSVLIEVEYTLTGKSTTTVPNIVLFPAALTSVTPATSNFSTTERRDINVPASTAPTCNFLIDQPNITLGTINVSDIANLTAGTAVASGQKNINITVNCAAGALTANATFAPQFSPTKSAVLTGNSSVALNDGTDNGVGFKLFDSSGTAMAFKTPLVATTNTLFSFTPTLQTVTKPFTLKYAKTSQAVKPGPVTSSITVTFSIL
jgi:type 1 fimbria pilin